MEEAKWGSGEEEKGERRLRRKEDVCIGGEGGGEGGEGDGESEAE